MMCCRISKKQHYYVRRHGDLRSEVFYKKDKEGIQAMCKAMEDMRDEAALAARLAERKEVASRLLKKGAMSFEEIAEISQLSVEEVRALAGKRGA